MKQSFLTLYKSIDKLIKDNLLENYYLDNEKYDVFKNYFSKYKYFDINFKKNFLEIVFFNQDLYVYKIGKNFSSLISKHFIVHNGIFLKKNTMLTSKKNVFVSNLKSIGFLKNFIGKATFNKFDDQQISFFDLYKKLLEGKNLFFFKLDTNLQVSFINKIFENYYVCFYYNYIIVSSFSHKKIPIFSEKRNLNSVQYNKLINKYNLNKDLYFSILSGFVLKNKNKINKKQLDHILNFFKFLALSNNIDSRFYFHQFVFNIVGYKKFLYRKLSDLCNKKIYSNVVELNLYKPVLFSFFYLFKYVTNFKKSVVAYNVYDISRHSIDIYPYLNLSSTYTSPVIIQSSLNAISPKFKNKIGYLNLKNSPYEFSMAVFSNAIIQKTPPIYGIGIDHLGGDGEKTSGMTKSFFNKAILDNFLTHFTIDGSHKLNDLDKKESEFKKSSNFIISIIKKIKDIKDIELCLIELNDLRKISLYSDFRKFFLNLRLFILNNKFFNNIFTIVVNPGTQHHLNKKIEINTKRFKYWNYKTAKSNIFGFVLHGTSGLFKKSIYNSVNNNFYKINIAGLSLKVIYDSIKKFIKIDSQFDHFKYNILNFKKKLSSRIKSIIILNLLNNSNYLVKSNALKLKDNDLNFIFIRNYCYCHEEIDDIFNQLKISILK